MISLLITGHGEFANGLFDATEMIVGQQDNYKKVLFNENMNLDKYESEIKKNIEKLLEISDGVLVLTDLKGGTPFNVSVLLSKDYEEVSVISGANLPMTIEGSMQSQTMNSAKELANYLLEIGRQGIEVAELSLDEEATYEEEAKDGI